MPLGGAIPYDESGGAAGLDPDEKQAIQLLEQILQSEPDDSKSAELAAVIQKLYKLLADEQDTQMKMMGGDPKQMRQMSRAAQGGSY